MLTMLVQEISKVQFYLDSRQHRTESLVHKRLERFQEPALLTYNDAEFKPEDWRGIQNFKQSGKKDNPFKVGKFGIGFNSVYHITGEHSSFRFTGADDTF